MIFSSMCSLNGFIIVLTQFALLAVNLYGGLTIFVILYYLCQTVMIIGKVKARYNMLCGDDGANSNEDDVSDSTSDRLHHLADHTLQLTSSFYLTVNSRQSII